MAKETKQVQETFEQALTRKRNTVLELELNARYWKAQYELKHYTILENGLRPEYQAILEAKQEVLKQVDETVSSIEAEVQAEVAELAKDPSIQEEKA
jgi:hypothetical protein